MPHTALLEFSASLSALQAITWFKFLFLSVLGRPVTLTNTAGNSEKDASVLFGYIELQILTVSPDEDV